uniref:Uncharacterized protein n=1 Tax=Arundo donax TaxID=35708 RepID=A0A0A8XUH3_ARUDO
MHHFSLFCNSSMFYDIPLQHSFMITYISASSCGFQIEK